MVGGLRSRLKYANVVATLALFVALGGASYAATRLAANSVGTRQLAFPLGLKSREVAQTKAPVFVCPPRAHCPRFQAKTLVSVDVSLKRASKLLVIGQTDVSEGSAAKRGSTTLVLGVQVGGRAYSGEYPLSTSPNNVTVDEVIPVRAGRHVLHLDALAESHYGPARSVYFSRPQIAVIALPKLR
jgi:hypothetical protein